MQSGAELTADYSRSWFSKAIVGQFGGGGLVMVGGGGIWRWWWWGGGYLETGLVYSGTVCRPAALFRIWKNLPPFRGLEKCRHATNKIYILLFGTSASFLPEYFNYICYPFIVLICANKVRL